MRKTKNLDAFNRALTYLRTITAISGQKGHAATYHAACCAAEGFGLNESELRGVMQQWNVSNASPPWSERELDHKIREALKAKASSTRIGYLLQETQERTVYRPVIEGHTPRPRVESPNFKGVPIVWDGNPMGVSAFLKAAFQPGELVSLVAAQPVPEDPQYDMPKHGGTTVPLERLLELAERNGDSLESYFHAHTANEFKGLYGTYIRVNPMKRDGMKDADVTAYRHALVEFDAMDQDEQVAKMSASGAPITALIHSGGKSIHAWVRVDAKDAGEYARRVEQLYRLFPGVDTSNRNPSRFARLPGVRRRGSVQKLLALGMGAASWGAWNPPNAVEVEAGQDWSPDSLRRFKTDEDPTTLLGKRWLCKGGSCLWVGSSGIGKSSLVMQAMYSWALGRPFFGITPTRPLKTVLIQAENDYGDCAEEVQGIEAGLGISEEHHETIRKNIVLRREVCKTGIEFSNYCREQIKEHKPDQICLDPLLAYFGKDINSQEDCSWFFRTLLAPISEETGIVWHVVHHTPKPSKDGRAHNSWALSDFAYIGGGSAELTNWSRAVVYLKAEKKGGFRLLLPKRGTRAGLSNQDGTPAGVELRIDWAKDKILWEYSQRPEEPKEEKKGSKYRTKKKDQQAAQDTPVREANGANPPTTEPQPEVLAAASLTGVPTFTDQFRVVYAKHDGNARKVCAEMHIGVKKFYKIREQLLPTLPLTTADTEEL